MVDGAAGGPPEDRRVKLYMCDNEGQWTDMGTGHVAIVKAAGGTYNIVMRSEFTADPSGTPTVVLNTPLSMNDIYQQQGENLIVWEDPFMTHNLALSFQSSGGCQAMLDAIHGVQQGQTDTDDEAEANAHAPAPATDFALPDPEITSLGTLHATLLRVGAMAPHLRWRATARIGSNGYLARLFDIFEQCEDLDDIEALHTLFRIFIAIILFNDLGLLSLLFDPKTLMRLMGVFEYDPLFQRRLNHRQYLQTTARFHEAVRLPPELKAKIHETFRLQYLKDCVVARYMDDAAAATLQSIVSSRQQEILSSVCNDDDVIDAIGHGVAEATGEERLQVLRLVQEMQTFSKNVAPHAKAALLATLCANGILRSVFDLLVAPDAPTRRLAIDIVSQATQHEPGILRGFLLDDEEKGQRCALLPNLVGRLVGNSPDSERVEMLEILRQLLENGPKPAVQVMERAVVTGAEEMHRVLTLFYATCLPILIQPLQQGPDGQWAGLLHVVDLLGFCVAYHGDFAQRAVLQHGLIGKATALLGSPSCPTNLAAALGRFVKALLMAKEEVYVRQLVRADTFQVLFALLLRHRERGNLLFSTILAIFEVVRRDNLKLLLGHIVEDCAENLRPVASFDTINALMRQWELLKDADKVAVRDTLRRLREGDGTEALPEPHPPPEEPVPPTLAAGPTSPPPVALVAYGEEDDEQARAAKKRRLEQSPENPLTAPDAS